MLVKYLEQCLDVCKTIEVLAIICHCCPFRFFGVFAVFSPGLSREPPRSTASRADGFMLSSSGLGVQASVPLVLAFALRVCFVGCLVL